MKSTREFVKQLVFPTETEQWDYYSVYGNQVLNGIQNEPVREREALCVLVAQSLWDKRCCTKQSEHYCCIGRHMLTILANETLHPRLTISFLSGTSLQVPIRYVQKPHSVKIALDSDVIHNGVLWLTRGTEWSCGTNGLSTPLTDPISWLTLSNPYTKKVKVRQNGTIIYHPFNNGSHSTYGFFQFSPFTEWLNHQSYLRSYDLLLQWFPCVLVEFIGTFI